MSRYHLTEAYGELYNARLTEASFYDNLRFVDYLQQEEIEEVMESLIWEFMDYGDTLEEAVDTLEVTFSDDEVLNESLEIISEATSAGEMRMAQRRETRAKQKADAAKTTAERESNVRAFAKRDSDTAARARRAARSAAIRGALSGAKRNVQGAMATAHKQIRDKKAQLKQAVSSTVQRAQAGLSRVARAGRGAVSGAKAAWNAPAPAPRMSKAQYDANKAQRAQSAQTSQAGAFATPSTPRATAAAQGLRSATTADTNRPRLGLRGLSNRAAAPVNPATFSRETREKMGFQVKSKAGKPLSGGAAAPAIRSARKQRVNASVDYDLLTQYMIEDLIYEGYADTESQAVFILEDMSTETLTEFASIYLDD